MDISSIVLMRAIFLSTLQVAISLQIQKKRERPFNIGSETFADLAMNDQTGKALGIQRKISPSQAIVKSVGYLAFKPGKIGEFM